MALTTEREAMAVEENQTLTDGGFDFAFEDEPSLDQICPICRSVMKKTVQTVCGHRFCKSCLLELFRREDGHPTCPVDRNAIPEGGWFSDLAWERVILSLRVKCKNSETGCDWTGQIRDYQTHESETCPRFPIDCPKGCGVQKIPREEIESHMRDDCMMTMVDCPYKRAGCLFHDERRCLKAHQKASSEEHLRKVWSKHLKAESEIESMKERLDKLQEEQDKNDIELTKLKSSERKLQEENRTLRAEVAELSRSVQILQNKFPPSPRTRPQNSTTSVGRRPRNQASLLRRTQNPSFLTPLLNPASPLKRPAKCNETEKPGKTVSRSLDYEDSDECSSPNKRNREEDPLAFKRARKGEDSVENLDEALSLSPGSSLGSGSGLGDD